MLLSPSSSSSSSSSPLCGVFIHIFLRQTMSLGNTVLQLFCCYYSWCLYRLLLLLLLMQLSFHSVAVVLTLVQTKQIRTNIHKKIIQKHSKNNSKHSKYKYTYYQNTQTVVKTPPHTHTYTHTHITKQVKTTTVQDTRQLK